MNRLLQLIFLGHIHKWKIIDKRDVAFQLEDGKLHRFGTRYHLQCEKCGDLRFKDSSP